jgi:hypothetical protein
MPFTVNGVNVGEDLDLSLRDDKGAVVSAWQLGHLLEFSANPDDMLIKVTPITNGGRVVFDRVPGGWNCSVQFARNTGQIASLIAAMDYNFYNFGRHPYFTAFTSILNRDNSVDQYSWTRLVIHKGGFGGFRKGREVEQPLQFACQELLNASGVFPFLVGVGA